MPIIVLLLAILILLIGGPMALGFSVAVPVWLAWTGITSLLPILFWLLVGLAFVVFLCLTFTTVGVKVGFRKCPKCQTSGNPEQRYCQKCMHDFGKARAVRMPTRDLKL